MFKKLEDITDLHPAERTMMQMWNAFLPGVHITMLARKMTYNAIVSIYFFTLSINVISK